MTDKACAACAKRHETGNPAAPLQCRALPPVAEFGTFGVFPHVRADDYCHDRFELDPAVTSTPAPRARRARSGEAQDQLL